MKCDGWIWPQEHVFRESHIMLPVSERVALVKGAASNFTVPETFRKLTHRSAIRKVQWFFFLPIFSRRDSEGNEQKFGEEGD